MKRRSAGLPCRVAAAACAMLLACAASQAATTYTYPGAAPCNSTLQACVTGAGAGDTIEIAQNALIAETVDIDKSLTIQPAAGFSPQVQFLFAAVTTVSKDITVRGMTGGFGVRAILAPGGGNLTITVEDSTFTAATFSGVTVGDNGAAGTYGTLDATIRNNHIDVPDPGGFGCTSGISVVNTASQVTARVIGNSIVAVNQYQCGGIEAVVGGKGGGGEVLIERNEIRGSDFDWGIVLRHFGANEGDPTTPFGGTIVNNLVVGQNGNTGAPAGIVLSADGWNAQLHGIVVNNTVASGRLGMLVSARTDLGANIDATIANNIVALNSQCDIGIDGSLALVSEDHNLVSSFCEGFSPGPGTRVGNPRFVSVAGGDYHLLPESQAIDAGRDSALDPSFTTDLDGAARRFGPIDMGAYESPYRAPPNPVPASGPAGLAAAALLIAWLARRRLGPRLR
mgnify:CR=1 FL=1